MANEIGISNFFVNTFSQRVLFDETAGRPVDGKKA
jgi:hypothetical protein